ncbi:MAG: CinA family protein [Pseudolabrys sp.]
MASHPYIASCEIWTATDPAGQPLAEEERLRGGDKKIKACLMVDTLRQADAEVLGARLAKEFPAADVGVFRVLCQLGQGWRFKAMQSLLPIAEKIAAQLIARKETIAIAESSTGGLIAAALLAVPGASAYFIGGAVVYTKVARAGAARHRRCRDEGPAAVDRTLRDVGRAARSREARRDLGLGRDRCDRPYGNRYGDAAGHSCIAIAGPVERAITLETGSAGRSANMEAFAKRGLELLLEVVSAKS